MRAAAPLGGTSSVSREPSNPPSTPTQGLSGITIEKRPFNFNLHWQMHGGLAEKPHSELPAGEKRTLRSAIDGSPSRPDAKCIRGIEDESADALEPVEKDKKSNSVLFARCSPPSHVLHARAVRFNGMEEVVR